MRSRERARLLRVVGVLAHRRRELLHARRGLFQRDRLLFGTARQVDVARAKSRSTPMRSPPRSPRYRRRSTKGPPAFRTSACSMRGIVAALERDPDTRDRPTRCGARCPSHNRARRRAVRRDAARPIRRRRSRARTARASAPSTITNDEWKMNAAESIVALAAAPRRATRSSTIFSSLPVSTSSDTSCVPTCQFICERSSGCSFTSLTKVRRFSLHLRERAREALLLRERVLVGVIDVLRELRLLTADFGERLLDLRAEIVALFRGRSR